MYKCSPSHSHPGGQALFLETYLNPSVTWALARVIDDTGYVYVCTMQTQYNHQWVIYYSHWCQLYAGLWLGTIPSSPHQPPLQGRERRHTCIDRKEKSRAPSILHP